MKYAQPEPAERMDEEKFAAMSLEEQEVWLDQQPEPDLYSDED